MIRPPEGARGVTGIDADAHRLMRAGRLREALPLAERAVANAQVCLEGHGFLANLLIRLERAEDADAVIRRALALPAGDAAAYDGLAYASMLLNRHDRAHQLYRRATALAPDQPRYWYNLACSERSFGRLEAAAAACDRCIALDPAAAATYLLRSDLQVQTPAANHVGQLQARLAQPGIGPRDRVLLGYALAKEFDDLGRTDEAFEWFLEAARTHRSQLRYDVDADERTLARLAAAFPSAESARGRETEGRSCIFIVGLPRSGTTLLERILAGLPGVRSNGETHHFARALTAAAQNIAGDAIARAAAADPRAIAAHYLRLAGARGAQVSIIEKLPTNYLYLGAIRRALPAAALVLVTRAPLDSCFAMFRTLFGDAFPFTYDFAELARYYAAYQRLMHHWRSGLGGTLLEVVYEDLVRDPGHEAARVARHCGLTWTDAALDITHNRSVSLTASAAQVRQPIYGTSTGRWRKYRRHLTPLIDALRRERVALPDDA
jgi:tetratricopeptide (TPR) repeat protein